MAQYFISGSGEFCIQEHCPICGQYQLARLVSLDGTSMTLRRYPTFNRAIQAGGTFEPVPGTVWCTH